MIVTRKKINPCLPEDMHAWSQLKGDTEYRVIGIEDGAYRIQCFYMNDWRPTLYAAALFDVLDASVEPEWIVDLSYWREDDEYSTSIGFLEFSKPGFWEDVHDDRPDALSALIPIFDRLGLSYNS